MPWASYKLDERGLVMRDENNLQMLTGECVEVLIKTTTVVLFEEVVL